MKVGFTGTRDGMTELQWRSMLRVVKTLFPHEFHHGDCVGADDEAANLVYDHCHGVVIVSHPPIAKEFRAYNQKHRAGREPLGYLDRDRAIVDETFHLIACPRGPEEQRSGTWYTVRYARKRGRKITIIYPDGSVVEEPLSPSLAFGGVK